MHERITTWMDLAGVLAVVVGVVLGLWALIGPVALAVGGVLLLVSSRAAVWASEPASAPGWWRKAVEVVSR